MLTVEAIENGTVVDHISAGKGLVVIELLGIKEDFGERVALVMNVPSKRMKKKDIVKIAGVFVSQQQANLIALVSPKSSINIIKNGKVSQKYVVKPPGELIGVGKCPNPRCITNTDHPVQKFKKEGEVYRCYYCERLFKAEELVK